MELTEFTKDQINLLKSLAWKYHLKTGVDADDLFSEACLGVIKLLGKYDPARSDVNTFLYAVARYQILRFLKTQVNGSHHQPMPKLRDMRLPDMSVLFVSSLKALSPRASRLCMQIIKDPEKYSDMQRTSLQDELLADGWGWDEIRSAFKEIKSALRGCNG